MDRDGEYPKEHELRKSMQAFIDGRLSEVSPEQCKALEAFLNEPPERYRELETALAKPDVQIVQPDVPLDRLERVWENIDQSLSRMEDLPGKADQVKPNWRRRLAGIAGMAAALALVVIGRSFLPGSASHSLILASTGEVEIESMEVFDDSMPLVMNAGGDDEVAIIWVAGNGM